METMGVSGIWGLEQLERTGISTWKCGLILLAVAVAFNYLVLGIQSGIVDAFFFGSLEGVYLLAALALSRATQADLERLLPSDEDIAVSIRMLKPTRKSLLVWFLLSLLVVWAIFAYALTRIRGIGFAEFHQDWVLGGIGRTLLWYVGVPVYSLTAALMLAVMVTQAGALRDAVRRVEIDILQLGRYPHLANPLIRIISVMLIILSVLPLFSAVMDDEAFDQMMLISMPGTILLALIVTGLYAYPIWMLKGRIREAKRSLSRVVRHSGGSIRERSPVS